MSRSNPVPTNPAKRFFRWRGGKGELTYYDKEKQEEVAVKLPFEFLVLDELATVTGFCEADSSSYWSNEVRSVAKEKFVVRTSKGIKQSDFYEDLTDVRSKGAKYAKSIYIAFQDEDGLSIGNIKASGSALTSWIDLGNKQVTSLGKIVLTGNEKSKKGATTYYVPTFEWKNAEGEEDEIAKELDQELQEYFTQYLKGAQNDEPPAQSSDGSLLPDEVHMVIEGKPVNLDNIPY